MIVPQALLKYAVWLFARALQLRETGDIEAAEKLEQRAAEYLDQAKPDGQREPEE